MSKSALTKILAVVNVLLAAVLFYILWSAGAKRHAAAEVRVFFYRDPSALPLWVAVEKGFFDTTVVKVKTEEIPRLGDEVGMVSRGAVLVGVGFPWEGFISRASADLDKFRLVYTTVGTKDKPVTALVAWRESGVKTLKDLAGKRVGYLQDLRLNLYLKPLLAKEGVDTAGVKLVPLSFSEMRSAFIDKRAEALVAPEPLRTYFLSDTEDVVLVEDAFLEKHLVSPYFWGATVTSIANLRLRAEATKAVVDGLKKGLEFVRSNPSEAGKILRENLGLENLTQLELPQFADASQVKDQELQAFFDALKGAGAVLFEMPQAKVLLQVE